MIEYILSWFDVTRVWTVKGYGERSWSIWRWYEDELCGIVLAWTICYWVSFVLLVSEAQGPSRPPGAAANEARRRQEAMMHRPSSGGTGGEQRTGMFQSVMNTFRSGASRLEGLFHQAEESVQKVSQFISCIGNWSDNIRKLRNYKASTCVLYFVIFFTTFILISLQRLSSLFGK